MGGRKIRTIEGSQEPGAISQGKESGKVSEAEEVKKAKKPVVPRIKKIRGKKYQEAKKKIEPRAYPVSEAVKLVKTVSTAGFDASVDVHVNLGLGKDTPEHQLRSFLALPHGTGKSVKVLVFADGADAQSASEAGADQIGDDATIETIAQGKLPAVDAVIATPVWMPKLAKVARFLGPKGLMPTPKSGTVSDDPAAMVKQLKQGRVEIKTEAAPVVHVAIGKVSSPDGNLIANLKAIVAELNRIKPPKVSGTYIRSVFLAPTMGPSVKVDLASLS
uniref:Large ribosomal subunit protein uL1 n=1 Tax=candidate division WWE3 bacterium TaxID=2053526 RepID=A0A831YZX6_UNCKA